VLLLKHLKKDSVVRLSAVGLSRERLGINEEFRQTMLAGAIQRHRILLVAYHRDDLRLDLPRLDRIDDGLEIGASAGGQDGYTKRR
jgi:hypothetical protein